MNTNIQPDNVGNEDDDEKSKVVLNFCDVLIFWFLLFALLVVPQLIDSYWS